MFQKQSLYQLKKLFEKTNGLETAKRLMVFGSLLSIAWSFYFSVITITMHYQIELREGNALFLTQLLLNGKNPFNFENQPLAMTNYGIGYDLVVLPFAALFGSTLLVHRAVTFAFILLSALICFIVVRKKHKEGWLGLICGAFVVVSLIGRGGIGATPSALGTFLFLAAILVPYIRSFDKTSLVTSVLIALFAFYTKPYFILAFGIVAAYLFLFVSKQKGVFYVLLFLPLFSIAFLAARVIFPLYFIDVLIGNINNITRSPEHLKMQLAQLFLYFYPMLVLVSLMSIRGLLKRQMELFFENRTDRTFDLLEWNQPLIKYSMNYLFFSSVCSFLAFILILGPHIGNYLNYAYQILIPVSFCWLFQYIDLNNKFRVAITLLILFNLFMWEQKSLNPNMLTQKNSKEWAELYSYISHSKNVLNDSVGTSELVELGRPPMDAGQTLVYYISPYRDINLIGPSYSSWYDNGVRYTKFVDQSIKNKNFDLVITSQEKATFYHTRLLDENYSMIAKIEVEMPQTDQSWTMLLWQPLPK